MDELVVFQRPLNASRERERELFYASARTSRCFAVRASHLTVAKGADNNINNNDNNLIILTIPILLLLLVLMIII